MTCLRLLTQLWLTAVALVMCASGCRTPPSHDPNPETRGAPTAPVVATLTPDGPPPTPSRTIERGQPRVVQFGPQTTVDGAPHIFVRFSHPMETATEGDAAPTITLDPPAEGSLRWIDPYRLAMDVHGYLPDATRFEVTARGDLKTTAGETLRLDSRWSFETERIQPEIRVLDGYWYAGDETGRHWNTPFAVSAYGHAVPLAAWRKHVHATARTRDGKTTTPVPVVVRNPSRTERETFGLGDHDVIVRPRGHWPGGHTVAVTIGKDLTIGGPLPIGRDIGAEIDVEAGMTAELECFEDHGDGCDPGPLRLTLTRPVDDRALRHVQVTPRPKKLKIVLDDDYGYGWGDDASHTISVYGEFVAGQTYRVALGDGLRNVHGQALAVPFDRQVAFVDPPPMISLASFRGTLVASDKRTIGLHTRWVRRARVKMAVLDDDQLLDQFLRAPEDLRFPKRARNVVDETLDLTIEGSFGWSAQALDLTKVSGPDRRPVLVQVEAVEMMPEAAGRPEPKIARGLFQQTDLGVVSVVSPSRSVAAVSRLSTAAAAEGIDVELFRGTLTVPAKRVRALGDTTDQGLVDLPRSTALPKRGLLLVHDAKTDDRTVVRVGELRHGASYRHWYYRNDNPYEDGERLLSQMATDRPLYRPGEKIRVVGWAAISTNHTPTGLRPPEAGAAVKLRLEASDGELIDVHQVRIKEYGKYWGTLQVPDGAELGAYRIVATLGDDDFDLQVRVKDFRTPTFEVQAVPTKGDVIRGDDVDVRVAATYYFGGKVPIDKLRHDERCSPTWFRPVDLPYRWRVATRPWRDLRSPPSARIEVDRKTLPDAAQGRANLTFATDKVATGAPFSCTASIALGDRSYEEVGAEAQWLVHPPQYLALRGPEGHLRKGDRAEIDVRTVEYTGTRTGGARVDVSITRHWYKTTGDGWTPHTDPLPSCDLKTTAKGDDAGCKTGKLEQGRYVVTARFADDDASPVAEATFWVGPRVRPYRWVAPARLEVEVSPETPKPGETAQIRISSPHKEGRGLVVLSHGGVRRLEPFVVSKGQAVVEVTVDQSWVPGMQVDALMPEADGRPGMQQATTTVRVQESQRDLAVEVDAPTTARPGEEIAIAVQLRDHARKPTAGHVAIWAVDEAVLSLDDAVIPELAKTFTVDRGARVSIEHDYDEILLPYTPQSDPYVRGYDRYGRGGGSGSGYGSGSGAGFGGRGARGAPPPARGRFETTPIFIGDAEVDDSGAVTVRGTMPENLTTFRITAIASSALPGSKAVGRFGHGEARTRVTVPVALRVIAPRILRPGDEAEIAALVDNLGGPAGTVAVELTLPDNDGQLRIIGDAEAHAVPIDAGGQVRVPFSVAAIGTGEPKVQMRVRLTPGDAGAAAFDDAMVIPLPVEREPNLVRHSAVYGSVDGDAAAVQVQSPSAVVGDSGKLTVQVDASLLAGLQDVAKYLVTYPYGCVEQTSSSMLPLVALGELTKRFPLGVEDVDSHYRVGLHRLRAMQTSSGGFGYWPDATRAHLYGSAYATWVLELAAEAGLDVPAAMRTSARRYLYDAVADWASLSVSTPHDDVPIAMALHALAYGEGKAPKEAVDRLAASGDQLPTFARALLTMALHRLDPKDRRVAKLVAGLEQALDYEAGFARVRDEGGLFAHYFDTRARTNAMVLLALIEVDPDHTAVEPLARGLMRMRSRGGFRNTQENAYALLGLAAYARHYEKEAPDMTAHVWVGDETLMSPQLGGEAGVFASEEASHALVAARDEDDGPRVTLQRRGKGRLYYRVDMQWSPPDAGVRAIAAGLAVATQLRDASGHVGPDDVIEPGTLLALDVTVTADTQVDYVAVDVPLPAGLEAVDRSIGRGRSAMTLHGSRGYGVSHEEIRKDRTLFFADSLPAGKMTHTVYLRATSPGTFFMPPTSAASMYFPDIHGSAPQRKVRVASPK